MRGRFFINRTPLYNSYSSAAKLVDFGGWELPVRFSSIKEEHLAVRQNAGLFDVSHMGEFEVSGPGSEAFLQIVSTNNISNLPVGSAHYTLFCYENGGTVDDLLIYNLGEQRYLLVVNAANISKDFDWLQLHKSKLNFHDVNIIDRSSELALLALQGPRASSILQQLVEEDLSQIKRFSFKNLAVSGIPILLSRSGYTGEDGFELYIPQDKAVFLWEQILAAGEPFGLLPCGLGARDTLRLEAALSLYGQELSSDITPIEAGLQYFVKLDKEFIGKDVLERQKAEGPKRKLVGLKMKERGIPRTNYEVYDKEAHEIIGYVTSGTQLPSSGDNVGLAILCEQHSKIGALVKVKIRDKFTLAEIVKTPFYSRPNSK